MILRLSEDWLGGVNYLYNLVSSVRSSFPGEVEFYFFVPLKLNEKLYGRFRELGRFVTTKVLERGAFSWFLNSAFERITQINVAFLYFAYHHALSGYSHSNLRAVGKCKTINWIPDFQHVYRPEFFTKRERRIRVSWAKRLLNYSSAVVLSSETAKSDALKFVENPKAKLFVLHFPSEVSQDFLKLSSRDCSDVLSRLGITGDYFFLPNQMWKHKNHGVLLGAVDILSQEAPDVQIVLTGRNMDGRDAAYSGWINSEIQKRSQNIKYLGVVARQEYFCLLSRAKALINPSFFEGWSTSVEEAKALGVPLVLSDIPVHHEQAGSDACYFPAEDSSRLASILRTVQGRSEVVRHNLEADMVKDSQNFAARFLEILRTTLTE